MNIKLVKRPIQNERTELEDIQYSGENWCVSTRRYMNLGQFFAELRKYEKRGCGNVYLYDIESVNETIVTKYNGIQKTWETKEQMVYYIRADYKK